MDAILHELSPGFWTLMGFVCALVVADGIGGLIRDRWTVQPEWADLTSADVYPRRWVDTGDFPNPWGSPPQERIDV